MFECSPSTLYPPSKAMLMSRRTFRAPFFLISPMPRRHRSSRGGVHPPHARMDTRSLRPSNTEINIDLDSHFYRFSLSL